MVVSKEIKIEFEKAARPLIKFLGGNFHPHVEARIGSGFAILQEGTLAFLTEDYIETRKPPERFMPLFDPNE